MNDFGFINGTMTIRTEHICSTTTTQDESDESTTINLMNGTTIRGIVTNMTADEVTINVIEENVTVPIHNIQQLGENEDIRAVAVAIETVDDAADRVRAVIGGNNTMRWGNGNTTTLPPDQQRHPIKEYEHKVYYEKFDEIKRKYSGEAIIKHYHNTLEFLEGLKEQVMCGDKIKAVYDKNGRIDRRKLFEAINL